jgi:hypothetical protein
VCYTLITMGVYINPKTCSKEQWLASNGEKIVGRVPTLTERPGFMPVCLVDNGPFTAAAVAYQEGELSAFSDPQDHRPKQWFLVETTKLLEVSDLAKVLNR